MTTIQVLGVYPIEAPEPCHLVEIMIRKCDGVIDFSQITQQQPGEPLANWQVPWMESFLDAKGEKLLSEPFQATERSESWHGDVRLVFYFHYLNLKESITTPIGNVDLPRPTSLPPRLSKILSYEEPG